MNHFETVATPEARRNKFDLSHEKKLTLDFGNIVPVANIEILPADSIKISMNALLKMFSLNAPIYHNIDMKVHGFFTPNRLVWDQWEKFITGGDWTQTGDTPPEMPRLRMDDSTKAQFLTSSLADYLGCPTFYEDETLTVNNVPCSMPFRAYQMIYNEYYRDQNLIAPIEFSIGDNMATTQEQIELTTLRKKAYAKDYFTSALPAPQKGDAINVAIGGIDTSGQDYLHVDSGNINQGEPLLVTGSNADGWIKDVSEKRYDIKADLEPVTVNDLRKAVRLQEYLEQQARTGSRFTEFLLSFWNVKSKDARLQRPEYLGGYSHPITISEVLNTADVKDKAGDVTGSPVGTQYGHGVGVSESVFTYSADEYGWLQIMVIIQPQRGYQNTWHKKWIRLNNTDYALPIFADLGEQEVRNFELQYYGGGDDAANNFGVFGYQSRFAEYKYIPSTVHGDFKHNSVTQASGNDGKLEFWHLDEWFSTMPALGQQFIEVNPSKRIFPVQDEDPFFLMLYFDISCIRALPYFSIPDL